MCNKNKSVMELKPNYKMILSTNARIQQRCDLLQKTLIKQSNGKGMKSIEHLCFDLVHQALKEELYLYDKRCSVRYNRTKISKYAVTGKIRSRRASDQALHKS